MGSHPCAGSFLRSPQGPEVAVLWRAGVTLAPKVPATHLEGSGHCLYFPQDSPSWGPRLAGLLLHPGAGRVEARPLRLGSRGTCLGRQNTCGPQLPSPLLRTGSVFTQCLGTDEEGVWLLW